MAEEGGTAPVSKLVEQATAKARVADLSYSYWAAKTSEYQGVPDPKLLSQEEATRHAEEVAAHMEQTGASAWNKAGTFEERAVSMAWVTERLTELLCGRELGPSGGSKATLATVASCTGDAHQWLVRGRKRAGFELEVRVTVEGSEGPAGTLRLTQVCSDDLDEMEIVFDPETGSTLERAELQRLARPLLLEQFQLLIDAIRQR